MLKLTLLAPVISGLLILSSCSPYQEAPEIPPAPADPALNIKKESKSITDKKQKTIKKARKKVSKETSSTKPKTSSESSSASSSSSSSTKPKPKKRSYPVATPVPGKDGYVFSPYNNKVINIQGLPSGSVVKDPNDPADAKRYFRVP